MLVSDLINTSLRIAGIMGAPQRGASPEELAEGFAVLNSMIDSWKSQRLMIYAEIRMLFDLNPGQQTYVIGRTSPDPVTDLPPDWIADRPEKIERAGFIFTNVSPNIEQPFRVLYSAQEWAAVSPKGLVSDVPYILYYEARIPNGFVNVFPIPQSAWQIALYNWTWLEQFVTTGDSVILPPAYQRCIEYNLGREMALRYPTRAKITPDAIELARSSKAEVKSLNTPLILSQCDSANNGRDNKGHWNITTNSYVPIN